MLLDLRLSETFGKLESPTFINFFKELFQTQSSKLYSVFHSQNIQLKVEWVLNLVTVIHGKLKKEIYSPV